MMTLGQLATMLGTELRGDAAEMPIRGVAGPGSAAQDDLVFAVDASSFAAALASRAAAVLVSLSVAAPTLAANIGGKPLLMTADPRLAFARAARLLRQPEEASGVHPTAMVGAGALLGPAVSIGAYAVLGDGCRIGEGSTVGAGSVVGAGVVLGRHARLFPRVVIYPGTELGDRVVIHAGAVLGGDGFGYVRDPATGEYIPFPQQGRLVIEDDVEIGANATIDRGALEETRIARGTKIDNLVHIGHNCSIGRDVVIAAQTGISGSCSIGNAAVLGGQVGIGDHASVGEGVILGGQAGILPYKKLDGAGVAFWGTPAQPLARYLRQLAAMARLGRKRK